MLWKDYMETFSRIKLIGLLILTFTTAKSQVDQSSMLSTTSERATSTNYFYARTNDFTIIVNVMGFVQKPGRYEIANSIDLLNLISLAGGPTADGSLDKVRIIRIIKDGEKTARRDIKADQSNLSVFLPEEVKITRQEIQLSLDNLSTIGPEDLQLMPGDVIFVDRTTWSTIRDAFGVVVSAAIITTAVSQIISVARNK